MTVVINGSTGITNPNSMTIGNGGGSVATNTAVGASALAANSTGANATAIGNNALKLSTTDYNTAVGSNAAQATTSGAYNSALGVNALYANTTGASNTALGMSALQSNTTASNNTAVGYQAGLNNTTGDGNVYIGRLAGFTGTTARLNTFVGDEAGGLITTGASNTFIGNDSGYAVTTGSKNTIVGSYGGNSGGLDIRTASNYIVLSDGDGNHRMFINGSGTWFYSNPLASAGTNAVKYNGSTGAISYDTSSARYKDNIRDSVYGLSHVMQMRSAQFEYKDTGRSDVGLIAEELDLIIPELVGKNADNQPDSVSYDRMVSVLVKAIQELKSEFDAYKEAHP